MKISSFENEGSWKAFTGDIPIIKNEMQMVKDVQMVKTKDVPLLQSREYQSSEEIKIDLKDTKIDLKDTRMDLRDTKVDIRDTLFGVRDTVNNLKDTSIDMRNTVIDQGKSKEQV